MNFIKIRNIKIKNTYKLSYYINSYHSKSNNFNGGYINSDLGNYKVPELLNEPMRSFDSNSKDRLALNNALNNLLNKIKSNGNNGIPIHPIINGTINKPSTNNTANNNVKYGKQLIPTRNSTVLATYSYATPNLIEKAIDSALKAKKEWETFSFADRAAIFLKAADLLTNKYRYDVMAATMLGQGKNIWQAEIDASAELADFWRFNTSYAQEIYSQQPPKNAPFSWNRTEYRPLDGFVAAYSPFNFTAIAGNLVGSPALMGNVVIWKPSPQSIYSNYLVYQILLEAGLPPNVIQFVPGDAEEISSVLFNHPEFAGLHFTGSTAVFKKLWRNIGNNIDIYKSYPRLVGETGGKNAHVIHNSADIKNAALQTIRGAFEYNGQKCSATSRAYIPKSKLSEFKDILKSEISKIKVGDVTDPTNFITAVINEASFDKISSYISKVGTSEDPKSEIIIGGGYDKSKGFYIQPTVIETTDPSSPTLINELFGPVLTIYSYEDNEYEKVLKLVDSSSPYALTCGLFAKDRDAIITGSNYLRSTAGNFYINDKSTGAVVGQQPFGGSRQSGTNDKAGSHLNLLRWTSPRAIKETFLPINDILYPSNKA